MTALTFNMHTQTVLWTGVAADDLDMSDEHRAAHEALRAELYRRIIEEKALQSQPLSEGIAQGATRGFATTAEKVDGGYKVNGRKIFASLSGAASDYNITCVETSEDEILFLAIRASRSSATGIHSACAARSRAPCCSRTPSRPTMRCCSRPASTTSSRSGGRTST
jgi:alkylation response protein AidB-like acyl-CoA dehydrogenase